MQILVVDPHVIYRFGLVASLELLPCVDGVAQARDGAVAASQPAFAAADVVILDGSISGACDFIRAAVAEGARVIVIASEAVEQHARDAIDAGAVGYLRKDTLTQDVLEGALLATRAGATMIASAVLGAALRSGPAEMRRLSTGELSTREQRVLALIAEGHPTREVATELCYSERTVKNVLHDIVTKLNARSRSHAIACAVRGGLI